MGVVRYLCITILLVSLAAAQSCSSEGWSTVGGTCVCNSGFNGADCSNNFGSCNASTTYVASNWDEKRYPVLSTTKSFEQNYLQLSIVGPVVPNRKYLNIQFVDQTDDQCKLNSTTTSYWSQDGNTACQDEFHLNMPWVAWASCGFGPGPKGKDLGDVWEYRATFVIYYVDNVGQPFKFDDIAYQPVLYRHSSVAYKVYARFQKVVSISISQVLINSTTDLVGAITKFEYNPANQILSLGIKTIMTWPNMYLRDTVSVAILNNNYVFAVNGFNGNNMIATPLNDTNADSCSGDGDNKTFRKNCMQYWEVRIQLTSGYCDFNADYLVSGTARTCRDADLNKVQSDECTTATQQIQFKVTHSDVCGSVTANPLISGKLLSYDIAHNAQTEFVVGYKGYFEVDMQTENSFNMTWVDIWAVADSQTGDLFAPPVQYLLKGGVVQTTGFVKYDNTPYADDTFASSPVQLNVHTISQNDNTPDTVYTPKFDLVFDSRIFHIAFSGEGEVKRGFTIHAIGRIVYAGNEQYNTKRSEEVVDFVWESSSKDMNTKAHVGLAAAMPEAEVAQTSSSNGPAAYYFYAPVAGIACVVIAAAVAAAVVAKKRSANSFAALAN